MYVSFSTLYSSSLWRTDTIVVSKLNILSAPSLLSSSPSNGFEINKPPPGGGLIEDFRYEKNLDITIPRYSEQISGALNDCFL